MALILALILGLTPLPSDSLTVQYVANAGVILSDGETSLLIDLPYTSGAYDLMTYDPSALAPTGRVVVVVTHRHVDHFEPSLFGFRGWEIMGPDEVTATLPVERVLAGRSHEIGAFRVEGLRTSHGDTEHYSYLVTWGGWRLYFVGDTEDPSYVLGMADLDVVFITPWLTCQVEVAGGSLNVELEILYHQFPDGRIPVCGNPRMMEPGESTYLARR